MRVLLLILLLTAFFACKKKDTPEPEKLYDVRCQGWSTEYPVGVYIKIGERVWQDTVASDFDSTIIKQKGGQKAFFSLYRVYPGNWPPPDTAHRHVRISYDQYHFNESAMPMIGGAGEDIDLPE